MWIGVDRGVARFDGARFVSLSPAADNPFSGISGVVAPGNGDVWLNDNAGVVQLTAAELAFTTADVTFRAIKRNDRGMAGPFVRSPMTRSPFECHQRSSGGMAKVR